VKTRALKAVKVRHGVRHRLPETSLNFLERNCGIEWILTWENGVLNPSPLNQTPATGQMPRKTAARGAVSGVKA